MSRWSLESTSVHDCDMQLLEAHHRQRLTAIICGSCPTCHRLWVPQGGDPVHKLALSSGASKLGQPLCSSLGMRPPAG